MSSRNTESLSPLFEEHSKENKNKIPILMAPSDIGVRRNFGRNGARFAPKSIIHQFKKLNNHLEDVFFKINVVSSMKLERNDFLSAQIEESKSISKQIKNKETKKCSHIGGGHDHVYPLLKALETRDDIDHIICLNIDAHCDTRVDTSPHSGTPFRNFDENKTKGFTIIQFGIQEFANSKSTRTALKNSKEYHISIQEAASKTRQFTQDFDLSDYFKDVNFRRTSFLFSLDLDALDGGFMAGVSAVNPMGIAPHFINKLLKQIKKIPFETTTLGLYELNPVYDGPSNLGAKYCAQLMFDFSKK